GADAQGRGARARSGARRQGAGPDPGGDEADVRRGRCGRVRSGGLLRRHPRDREADRTEALGEMTAKDTVQRGLRVLIVEDEQALRDIFRDFVAGLGHEPIARARAESEQERALDRRPAPRVAVDLPVRLLTDKGVPWESTCTELSASGMKVVTRARLRPGHAVKIAFMPPGSDTPLDAVALVVRADKSGAALWFLDLLPNEVQRLRALVDRLRL